MEDAAPRGAADAVGPKTTKVSRSRIASADGGPKPTPLYARIVNAIADRISTGVYRSGDRLPPEPHFCKEFNASPMTVHRAFSVLEGRGLIEPMQGKGTFVRPLEIGEATFKLGQIAERWQARGTDVRLLEASTKRAEGRVAEKLQLGLGSRVVFLRRLVLEEDRPILYHVEYVVFDPHRRLVESQLQITSLAGILHPTGGEGLAWGDLKIQAVNLRPGPAKLLGERPDAAAFLLEHVFGDFSGRPVSWGWFLFKADQFYLETQIGSR